MLYRDALAADARDATRKPKLVGRLATIVARRPRTTPSASIRIHFFSISAGFAV